MVALEKTPFVRRTVLGLKRHVLARAFPIGRIYQVLNEYPKSGGTWIAQMVSDVLEIPFPENGDTLVQPSMIFGHFMSPVGLDRAIVVWRDGRDVLTSSYYFYTRRAVVQKGRLPNHSLVERTYKHLGLSPESGCPDFSTYLKMMLTNPVYPGLSWPQFVDVWAGRQRCFHVRYEDFRSDPHSALGKLIFALTKQHVPDAKILGAVEKFSFQKQSGRPAGTQRENHFLRKGIVGDWRTHFSEADLSEFYKHGKKQLLRLRYSVD